MASPIPKPVELKILEGNPGKRRLPRTPKFAPLTEHPPESLPREGKAEWRRLMREFERLNLARRPDRSALFSICREWAVYIAACKDVQDNGLVLDETTVCRGKTISRRVKNPAQNVARDALAQLIQLWSRFGMTPADRARLDMPEVQTDEAPGLHLLD